MDNHKTMVSFVTSHNNQCNPEDIDIRVVLKQRLSNKIKVQLPAITPSCTYKYDRVNKSKVFNISSNLLFIDIDHKDNLDEEMDQVENNFKKLSHTYMIKRSSSGKGLHILLKGQFNDIRSYDENYLAVCEKIESLGIKIDRAAKGLTKLMYLNSCKNIYINERAIPFTGRIKTESNEKKKIQIQKCNSDTNEKPWIQYNNCDHWQNLIQEHGFSYVSETQQKIFFKRDGSQNPQSANYCKKTKRFWSWSDFTQLEANKAYSPFDLLLTLNNWSKVEACLFINKLLAS